MTAATAHRYLIALGSNRRHGRHGAPREVLRAALAALAKEGVTVVAVAPIISSAPVGPSLRRYANTVALGETTLGPDDLLALLKHIERAFGRCRGGRRWGSRVLDLDIVLWSGGMWGSPGLVVPHPRMRERDFVLGPATALAPAWRDPVTGRTLCQLRARLTRLRPTPNAPGWSGP